MSKFHRALAFTAVGVLALAACGSDEATESTGAPVASEAVADSVADSTPVATEPAAGETTPATDPADSAAVPTKIVSLYPTGTEMLYAIGAGDQVIAVDDQSNFPAEAASKVTDLSGYEPNVEAIAAYEPDLVIHDGTTDIGAQLDALGIPNWAGPAAEDFGDIYTQLEQLGATTGHVAEAAELVGQMETDIAAAVDSIPAAETPLKYYHELDNTYFSVTSDTFIGQVYSLFGMQNVADTAEGGTSYPQLSAEFIISQNPDIIFLADADYGETVELVVARPGWDAITAVSTGAIVPVSADISSRWGPRIVDYIQAVSEAAAAVAVPA